VIYIKNNDTVYPLNKELKIIYKNNYYHLCIGEKEIMIEDDKNKILQLYDTIIRNRSP